MASSNQTMYGGGGEIESDTTQRTVTLIIPGGVIANKSTVECWVNVDGGTVTTTDAALASVVPLPANGTLVLPNTCRAFTHKTAASTAYLIYKAI